MAPEVLLPGDVRACIVGFRDVLVTHQEAINRLNVYPVPDGDTGTNMRLTMTSVVDALDGVGDSMSDVCKAVSHGSLMGARGNSGVILSQILRGMTEVIRDAEVVGAAGFSSALSRAAELAYQAVQRPVEGTILTVVREAAASAAAAPAGSTLLAVVEAARIGGQEALDRTPDLLPVLAAAGVVDAGGAGLLFLLDAVLVHLDGRPVPDPPKAPGGGVQGSVAAAEAHAGHGALDGDRDVSELRYEVMYLLEAPDEAMPAFREVWAGIGDSIVVVGGDGIFNCHIHTDDIGAAVEAAIEIGRPRQIRVTDLLEQVEEERWVLEADEEPEPEPEPVPCGVVAVATGSGIRRIFWNLHVQRVVTGGQSMNPSTADLLDAVEAVPAPEVVILPNNKNIIPVAEQVDALSTKSVRVLPTRSITEGFAALLSYDPHASADDNLDAMADACSAVVNGEVTQAVRPSTCDAGPIAEGDWIGVARDGIKVVATDVADAACGLLDALIADHELVTIIEGDGSSAAATRHITEHLAEHHPDVAAEVHHGGQPLYAYLFGIE